MKVRIVACSNEQRKECKEQFVSIFNQITK